MTMTQEEKQLLFVDLSTRLPYGVIVALDEKFGFNKGIRTLVKELLDLYCIEGMKPYLRPMSSMTEEEERELRILWNEDLIGERSPFYIYPCYSKTLDFYNSHHFDYRGLIEKGLAIEVTKKNNPYKK